MKKKDTHLVQSKVQGELMKVGQARRALEKATALIFEIIGRDPTVEQILKVARSEAKGDELIDLCHLVVTGSKRGISKLSPKEDTRLRQFVIDWISPVPSSNYLKSEFFQIENGFIKLTPALHEQIKSDCTVDIDRKTSKLIAWAEAYCDLLNNDLGIGFKGPKGLPFCCVQKGKKIVVDIDKFF